MALPNLNHIGEATINKIATKAFETQVTQARELSVNVKVSRQNLRKGILESLEINGQGLIMKRGLSLEQMNISLHEIGVNPLKALMGNVQLTKPSEGNACIILTEKDICTALNIGYLNGIASQYDVSMDNHPVHIKFENVNCRILSDHRIMVEAKVLVKETNTMERVCILFKPIICDQGNGVLLDDLEYVEGKGLSSIIIDGLISQICDVFNLDHFVIDGISLQVNNLDFSEGMLRLSALAGITHFPMGSNG
ncbi:DUF2993 domain-containing protein [Cyanobacterium sp. IPPAS B-1200]|uniref:LmeA family phospholipid-binding protein n=1 Tax=Cyanobacterium sp. IPPAS B-1200 TaxID=1562720 RepID=UPI00085247B9|nr:DUF2993 domain-containing protein [Cyanobacterium sp. IPPAS B-1200]OEJ79316.1 hypothetical protein A5482_00175 [Cyanobacterium sp. IPPAS B-1200]